MTDLRKLKIILTVSVLALSAISAALFIKAYFLNNPIKVDSGVENAEYHATQRVEAAEVGGVYSNLTNGSLIKFSEGYQSQFSPPFLVNKKYLIVSTNNSKLVGFLDEQLRFNLLFELPLAANQITLIGDSAIAYVLIDERFGGAGLYYRDNSDTFPVLTMEAGKSIDSFKYIPSEKAFYVLSTLLDGKFEVLKTFGAGSLNTVFSSYSYGQSSERRAIVNAFNNIISLCSKQNICNTLNLETKSLKSESAEKIQWNDLSFLITRIQDNQLFYLNQKNGESIQITDASMVNIQHLSFYDGKIYFSFLNQNNIEERIFMSFTVETKEVKNELTVQTAILPNTSSNLLVINNDFYLVTYNSIFKLGKTETTAQVKTGQKVKKLDVIDPVNTQPVAPITVTPVVTVEYFTKELGMNIPEITKIEIMEQQYLI